MRSKRPGEPDAAKKSNRKGKPIMVYVKPAVRQALDAYIGSQMVQPKITAVVEVALERFLEETGFLTKK